MSEGSDGDGSPTNKKEKKVSYIFLLKFYRKLGSKKVNFQGVSLRILPVLTFFGSI